MPFEIKDKSEIMNTHKIETVLTEDGTLTLPGLPFHAGGTVEVIILQAKTPQPQDAVNSQSEKNRYPLRGTVIRYDDPTEPVALEDWEFLQ
ncbi:hypothetical protein SAMD00079811_28780 [Scytonema sp. HK-05]|nr:hypothetical protein SAMD00079811_28780 [Scytonema sp. HK-05]